MKKIAIAIAIVAAGALSLAACGTKTPAESAIDNNAAMMEAGLENAADNLEDMADNTANSAEAEAMENAADNLEDAKDNVEDSAEAAKANLQ